jgi:protein phosphatase
MWTTSSLVPLKAPLKICGDLHGQFGDLQRFFAAFGSPNAYTGDVDYCSYLFLGDYVDRGKHSLEVVALLLALKICHPSRVTLLRGNHEDPQVNAHYGFRQECMRRCRDGAHVWTAINQVFEMMPVAALIDDVVLAVHGGIGESLQSLDQLRELPRPVSVNLSQRNVLNEVSH